MTPRYGIPFDRMIALVEVVLFRHAAIWSGTCSENFFSQNIDVCLRSSTVVGAPLCEFRISISVAGNKNEKKYYQMNKIRNKEIVYAKYSE